MKKHVYAFKNTDEEVMKSTSGGAFIGLCHAFELLHKDCKKYIYGAELTSNLEVRHTGVTSAKECSIFQGSKYVKSDCKDCYFEAASQLKNGCFVMFSGTPCQVAALKNYISREGITGDHLITVDLICHGTPKTRVWNDYKEWLEKRVHAGLKEYSFRYKPEGWRAYPAYACFDNGVVLKNTAELSVFSRLHMTGYITAKACFSCPFSNLDRPGDITLGDFWGIEKMNTAIPWKYGVSLMLVNTDKGMELVKCLSDTAQKNQGMFLEEVKSLEYRNYQHNLSRQTEKPEHYDEFWKDYDQTGFEAVIKKYINYGMKYKLVFLIKKAVRKTPFIYLYRKKRQGKIR
nr:Coenzyme F420 hydrogenase/dehydrogenase, beta subunit C-terminal domain [uncultured Clostridium sp.]